MCKSYLRFNSIQDRIFWGCSRMEEAKQLPHTANMNLAELPTEDPKSV